MLIILMASYNGAAYLEEQLSSLLEAQTVQDFSLLISDDGSTDGTWEILKRWQQRYAHRMTIRRRVSPSGGAAGNFLSMMVEHGDDYVMLCDQDDVWLPHKVEWALRGIKKMEKREGKETPCLFHTDLQVVDTHLQMLSPSFAGMVGMRPIPSLKGALLQNDVTGCTAIYNRALFEKIKGRVPEYCVMHDWWIALVAHAFGKKEWSPRTPILYRQHGGNVYGAKKAHGMSYFLKKIRSGRRISGDLKQMYVQAGSFLSYYREELPLEEQEMLTAFASLPFLPKVQRIRSMQKNGFFRPGFKRRFSQIIWG